MEMFWFIPTTGDGRYLGSSHGSRLTDYAYLRQIAQAVDELGYGAVLLPTGNSCEDAWVMASTLMPSTKRLKFLVAVRPGVMSPTLAARMTATFDRLSQGRLLINVVTGGDPQEAAADGVFLSHDERYEVTGEFLTIWRSILAGETRSFEGKHLRVENARVYYPATQHPHPPLYLGGSSDAAMQVAADHVDVYLTWGEPPAQVAEKIGRMRQSGGEFRQKNALRHPAPCDRAGDQQGGVASSQRSHPLYRSRRRRTGPTGFVEIRFRRPKADGIVGSWQSFQPRN